MNKVSAQQIRSLEIRIARLEREASFQDVLDDITGFIKGVVNIPKNFIKNIINVLKDVGNNLKATFAEQREVIREALESALGIRVAATLQNFIVDTRDMPVIVELNVMNPIKSVFTGGKAGSSKYALDKLASLYDRERSKRIKSAYLSWKSDYSSQIDLLQGRFNESDSIKRLMKFLQRSSKIAYRFFKVLFSIVSMAEVIAAPWGSWIVDLATITVGSLDLIPFLPKESWTLSKVESLTGLSFTTNTLSKSVVKTIPATIITSVLKLLEKAFYRYGVNVDAFDEEAMGRTASQYPRVASVTRTLEHYII